MQVQNARQLVWVVVQEPRTPFETRGKLTKELQEPNEHRRMLMEIGTVRQCACQQPRLFWPAGRSRGCHRLFRQDEILRGSLGSGGVCEQEAFPERMPAVRVGLHNNSAQRAGYQGSFAQNL